MFRNIFRNLNKPIFRCMCYEPTVSYLLFQGGSVMRITVGELEQTTPFSAVIDEFIALKEAQGKSKRTMKDLRQDLQKFYNFSSKTLNCEILKKELVKYFSLIPSTSAAVTEGFQASYSSFSSSSSIPLWRSAREYFFISSSMAFWMLLSFPSSSLWIFRPTGHSGLGASWK